MGSLSQLNNIHVTINMPGCHRRRTLHVPPATELLASSATPRGQRRMRLERHQMLRRVGSADHRLGARRRACLRREVQCSWHCLYVGAQLINLVIGAGLAMLAQAVVQLRVVPRVEARKRREDRWERDVLALGELLTAELPDRATAARREQWFLQLMNSLHPGEDKAAEHAEVVRGLVEKASEAVQSYEAVAKTRVHIQETRRRGDGVARSGSARPWLI